MRMRVVLGEVPALITVFFQDLLEVKHALIDRHCLTEDRKKILDAWVVATERFLGRVYSFDTERGGFLEAVGTIRRKSRFGEYYCFHFYFPIVS